LPVLGGRIQKQKIDGDEGGASRSDLGYGITDLSARRGCPAELAHRVFIDCHDKDVSRRSKRTPHPKACVREARFQSVRERIPPCRSID
jgi:hypothetical protein